MSDPLAEYTRARDALRAERERLFARIGEIDAALQEPPVPADPSVYRPRAGGARLPQGTLRDAALAWLAAHPGWHSAQEVATGAKAALGLVGNHSQIALAVCRRRGLCMQRPTASGGWEYAARGTL